MEDITFGKKKNEEKLGFEDIITSLGARLK